MKFLSTFIICILTFANITYANQNIISVIDEQTQIKEQYAISNLTVEGDSFTQSFEMPYGHKSYKVWYQNNTQDEVTVSIQHYVNNIKSKKAQTFKVDANSTDYIIVSSTSSIGTYTISITNNNKSNLSGILTAKTSTDDILDISKELPNISNINVNGNSFEMSFEMPYGHKNYKIWYKNDSLQPTNISIEHPSILGSTTIKSFKVDANSSGYIIVSGANLIGTYKINIFNNSEEELKGVLAGKTSATKIEN